MNIFAVSQNPCEIARALDDRRLVKMTTETAQMLSDALLTRGGVPFYKKCNPNHPCTKWVGATRGNFTWTIWLLEALNNEFRYRYEKDVDHGAFTKGWLTSYRQVSIIPPGDITPFHNSSLFKEEADTQLAYRRTMLVKWNTALSRPRWTRVAPPGWIGQMINGSI